MIAIKELEDDLILGSDGNIFTIRPDGSDKTYLTQEGPGTTSSLASWSYDGSKIVYMRSAPDPSSKSQPYIWTMNADGSDKTQLTSGLLSGSAGTFSPDGKSILFTSSAGNAASDSALEGLELWTMNSDGTGAHPITHTPVSGLNGTDDPIRWSMLGSYSPDGTKIAYSSTLSGSAQIWVMNSDGSDKRQITFVEDDNSPQNAPAWSPDGDAIAYAGSEKEDLGVPTINIYTIKPDGSDLTRLTFRVDKLTSDIPAWSPNGDFIYFGSVKSGLMETWVMREDGTDQQALFPDTVYPSRLPITSTTFEDITSEIMNSDTVSDAISYVSNDNFSSDTAFVVWNDNGDSSCGCDGCF